MPRGGPVTDQQARELRTIGYEGRSIDSFLADLQAAAVDIVVDVRELPLSRRPGFSKTSLAAQLATVGIEYVHARSLGSPRAVRRRLREDGDYDAFFEAYAQHLDGQEEALEEVASLVATARICLMCYEAEPERCHRSLLASRLEKTHKGILEVVHH